MIPAILSMILELAGNSSNKPKESEGDAFEWNSVDQNSVDHDSDTDSLPARSPVKKKKRLTLQDLLAMRGQMGMGQMGQQQNPFQSMWEQNQGQGASSWQDQYRR